MLNVKKITSNFERKYLYLISGYLILENILERKYKENFNKIGYQKLKKKKRKENLHIRIHYNQT